MTTQTRTKIVLATTILAVGSLSYALAQGSSVDAQQGISNLGLLVETFTNSVIKNAAKMLMSLAMLAFFWGIVQYILGKRNGDSGKVNVGNDFMSWSLLALFVMFSVYGIIKFAQQTILNKQDTSSIIIPDIQFRGGGSNPTGGAASSGVENCNLMGDGAACAGQTGVCKSGQCVMKANLPAGDACTGKADTTTCKTTSGKDGYCANQLCVERTGSDF